MGCLLNFVVGMLWLVDKGLLLCFECFEVGLSVGINLMFDCYSYDLGGVIVGLEWLVMVFRFEWCGLLLLD